MVHLTLAKSTGPLVQGRQPQRRPGYAPERMGGWMAEDGASGVAIMLAPGGPRFTKSIRHVGANRQ
jgi:hypothetical protein